MKNDVCIKTADISYIESIAELENLCFSHPWSKRSLEEFFDNKLSYCIVATSHDLPDIAIGYIGAYIIFDNADITNIAVHPDYRRMSIGSKLIEQMIDHCKQQMVSRISLEVRLSNTIAQRLYIKHGFSVVGTRKNYYKDPIEDAVLMEYLI